MVVSGNTSWHLTVLEATIFSSAQILQTSECCVTAWHAVVIHCLVRTEREGQALQKEG